LIDTHVFYLYFRFLSSFLSISFSFRCRSCSSLSFVVTNVEIELCDSFDSIAPTLDECFCEGDGEISLIRAGVFELGDSSKLYFEYKHKYIKRWEECKWTCAKKGNLYMIMKCRIIRTHTRWFSLFQNYYTQHKSNI
jgi:hypothetical protein